jgi:DNA-binding MarR family transcriptional regulator
VDRTDRIVEDQLNAWASLIQAHSVLVGRLERDLLDQRSLPLSWYEVLLHLSRAPEGAMRMQDLSEAVLLSKSGVTRLIDRMEEARLVSRRSCAADRRGTYATITEAGAEAFRLATPIHLKGIQEHFGRHLSVDESRQLRTLLRKILEGNDESEADCSFDAGSDGQAQAASEPEPVATAGRR